MNASSLPSLQAEEARLLALDDALAREGDALRLSPSPEGPSSPADPWCLGGGGGGAQQERDDCVSTKSDVHLDPLRRRWSGVHCHGVGGVSSNLSKTLSISIEYCL